LRSDQFKQRKLQEIDGEVGEHHFGELRLETAQAKAQRIVAEELKRRGWQETDFVARRKHDPAKVQIARRLRRETTLSVKQIAERLHFGTSRSASFRLLTNMKSEDSINPAQGVLGF
jgi:hypothetical protein